MMLSSTRCSALALFTASVVSGCTEAPDVAVDYDRSVDFSAYSSFAWAGDEASTVTGDLTVPADMLEEIKAEIEDELLSKGYSQAADVSEADFAVTFSVGATTAIQPHIVSAFFADNESQWQWGAEYFEPGEVGQTSTRVIYKTETSGELIITAFDVDERRPVWRASGARVLNKRDLSGDEVTISADVERLLGQFAAE